MLYLIHEFNINNIFNIKYNVSILINHYNIISNLYYLNYQYNYDYNYC